MIVDVDVVIPTLGTSSLTKVISNLNAGNFKPKKIICVTYKNSLYKIKNVRNVKIITSFIKNQVYQRNLGFKYVTSKFVMQLDDDVYLNKNTLKNLYLEIQKKIDKNVMGPNYSSKVSVKKEFFLDFIKNLYHYLICGSKWSEKKYGKISPLTVSFPIFFPKKKIIETEWLPGGCAIYNSKLLKSNTGKFNFKGKSFCEDIFFSLQRKKKYIKHYAVTSALAYHKNNYNLDFQSFLSEMKIRKAILKDNFVLKLRFFIWALLELILRLIRTYRNLYFNKNKI